MATVLINETVKKYLLGLPKDIRKKLREKFEFLETGLWEGKLRVRKIKSVFSKCLFEAPVDNKNKVLFTLGADKEGTEKALFVYVWGITTRKEPSKKSRLIIPDNVPFLSMIFSPVMKFRILPTSRSVSCSKWYKIPATLFLQATQSRP